MGSRHATPAPSRLDFVEASLVRIAELSHPLRRDMIRNADLLQRIHNLARAARQGIPKNNPG